MNATDVAINVVAGLTALVLMIIVFVNLQHPERF